MVSDSIGRSITVSGKLLGVEDLAEEILHACRATALQPEQTRQKSRIDETYSRPGMTRSKLWAKSGSLAMPRAAKAFFMIGQATNSVVPGATVVSISVRQAGWTRSPMVRIVASRALISASPLRMLPRSCFV